MKKTSTAGVPRMGILQIINLKNGRILIERSNDIDETILQYRLELRQGLHENRQLQKDWNAFGEAIFRFAALEVITPAGQRGADASTDLEALERLWLDKLQPYGKRGYNGEPKRKG